MANSEIADFETMISGLRTYRESLISNCQNLNQAVQMYDEGVNDKTSHVYRKKVDKLCKYINPGIIEKINNLERNLQAQVDHLNIIDATVNAENAE